MNEEKDTLEELVKKAIKMMETYVKENKDYLDLVNRIKTWENPVIHLEYDPIHIKLFTHTDLDGIGCKILIRKLSDNSDIETLNYNQINQRIKDFILNKEYTNYSHIFITDISVNSEIAELIDNLNSNDKNKFILIDHHKSATWLNKYEWATVQEEIAKDEEELDAIYMDAPNRLTCGTQLLYKYIINNFEDYKYTKNLTELVFIIRDYDTWLWKLYDDYIPKKLNDLLYILGQNRFVDTVENNDYDIKSILHDNELLLEFEQEKINRLVERKNKELKEYKIRGYKVGVIFSETNISELGNSLSKLHRELDLIAIVGSSTIEYRTTKDDIDCSRFASLFNGGGHPKASGSPISAYIQNKIIKSLFKIRFFKK